MNVYIVFNVYQICKSIFITCAAYTGILGGKKIIIERDIRSTGTSDKLRREREASAHILLWLITRYHTKNTKIFPFFSFSFIFHRRTKETYQYLR